MFWVTVVCLVFTFAIPFAMRLRRVISIPAMVLVSVLANVAAVLKRFLIVVPSQTHGALIPIEENTYSPTYIEYGIIVGLFGFLIVAILGFGRLFPLVPSSAEVGQPGNTGTDSRSQRMLRYSLTGGLASLALAMIVLGLADSFRLFSQGELDPRIPYSPVIFAGGVMLFFCTAITYETIPGAPKASETHDTSD
jgi:hypothetical protein